MLYDKIIKIYPTLTVADFTPPTGTILLQNDSDGKGDYIKEWNHPTFTEPTADQLAALDAPPQPAPTPTLSCLGWVTAPKDSARY